MKKRLRNPKPAPKKSKGIHWGWFIAAALCGFIAISVFKSVRESAAKAQAQRSWENVLAVRKVIDGYHDATKAQRADSWWMETTALPTKATFDYFQRKANEMEMIVAAHARVSKEAQLVADRFKKVHPVTYVNGKVVGISFNGVDPSYSSNAIRVCFISHETALAERVDGPVWNSSRDMVILPAMEIPLEVYSAVIMHEFGHGRRHNSVDGKPDDADGSDECRQEETEMHLLSGDVLDAESKGAYRRKLDEILDRKPQAATFDDALTAFTSSDCAAFDEMFSCQTADMPEAALQSQAQLELCYRYCDRHGLGMKGKIAVYRWFEDNIFSVPGNPIK